MPQKIITPGEAQVSGIYKGKFYGNAAKVLANSGMDASVLRTNATLRKDEWKQMDTKVHEITNKRMIGVNDLISRGLVHSIGNGLGTTVFEYEDASDIEDAQISMDAAVQPRKDIVEFDINYLPLPIVHSAFSINIRKLEASRKLGQALDVMQAGMAARKVAEKVESMLFAGASSYKFGGGTLYGYQDFTHRNTGSLTANWDDSGADPVKDVIAMKAVSIADRHYGPWMLYIPTNFETALDEDYVSGYPKTIRARIKEIDGIIDVKVADFMTADNVILVEFAEETVRMILGLQPTTVEWESQGGMVHHFMVMCIIVTQLRADQDNRSGIQHWT
jgi:uncharacterized linocin/CFP29 family protein